MGTKTDRRKRWSAYAVRYAGVRGEDFVCLFVLFVGIGGFALSLNAKPADCRTWG